MQYKTNYLTTERQAASIEHTKTSSTHQVKKAHGECFLFKLKTNNTTDHKGPIFNADP